MVRQQEDLSSTGKQAWEDNEATEDTEDAKATEVEHRSFNSDSF